MADGIENRSHDGGFCGERRDVHADGIGTEFGDRRDYILNLSVVTAGHQKMATLSRSNAART
jgi:hypothetical protein